MYAELRERSEKLEEALQKLETLAKMKEDTRALDGLQAEISNLKANEIQLRK